MTFGMNNNRRNLPTEITFGDGHRQTITYDGFGRKLRVDYSQVPEALLTGRMELFSDNLYELKSTREYVGPYVFTNGTLEYSAFGGGYFDPMWGTRYYVTDWQGNNAAVVDKDGIVMQRTIYYPYGEPTIEPTGQLYLFGGKEREHAGGRNSYDFGARCLTPYGRWGVVDPMAEKYYSFSPYSYCVGDPINFIDPDGMETLCFSNNDSIRTYAENVPDNPNKLIVYSHGNFSGMDYNLSNPNGTINSGRKFIDAINKESCDYKNIENKEYVEIELKACKTGGINPNGKPNLAEKISKELPFAIVTAPNGEIETHYTISNGKVTNLSERVLGENHKPMDSQTTRTYFRGNEIDASLIPTLKYPIQCMGRLKQRPVVSIPAPILLPVKNISIP